MVCSFLVPSIGTPIYAEDLQLSTQVTRVPYFSLASNPSAGTEIVLRDAKQTPEKLD
jgi:hypothetical protein